MLLPTEQGTNSGIEETLQAGKNSVVWSSIIVRSQLTETTRLKAVTEEAFVPCHCGQRFAADKCILPSLTGQMAQLDKSTRARLLEEHRSNSRNNHLMMAVSPTSLRRNGHLLHLLRINTVKPSGEQAEAVACFMWMCVLKVLWCKPCSTLVLHLIGCSQLTLVT
jgi:hypothetical protein